MLCILSVTTNPYLNIATEEYLLKNFAEDIVFLYINDPSIIIGKHQNALAEINYKFVCEQNLPVIRRISGGGTVYHDEGNINFSFIKNGKEGHLIDFKKFTQPVIDTLKKLGIDAKLEGKNDLRVNGLKVSGNAEHVFKNRVLHHGTILFSTNLTKLSESLRVKEGKYADNAVKSIKSKVANIQPLIGNQTSVSEFKDILFQQVTINAVAYNFTTTDKENINDLATNKYKTWEWNFGYSPDYIFFNEAIINNLEIKISLKLSNGIISFAEVKSNNESIQSIESALLNKKHRINDILLIISDLSVNENKEELAWLFF